MAGDLDCLLRVAVPDMAAFGTIYRELVAAVPLKNVSSHFAMERVKDRRLIPPVRNSSASATN
jgi:Lrp/AsnC family transcriptional regulator